MRFRSNRFKSLKLVIVITLIPKFFRLVEMWYKTLHDKNSCPYQPSQKLAALVSRMPCMSRPVRGRRVKKTQSVYIAKSWLATQLQGHPTFKSREPSSRVTLPPSQLCDFGI